MAHRIPTFLKTYRKQTHLTQDELALLLGLGDGSQVSRLERNQCEPTLEMALACQVTFGALPHEVFPGIYDKVEGLVVNRAHVLSDSLKKQKLDEKQKWKLGHLSRITERNSTWHIQDES